MASHRGATRSTKVEMYGHDAWDWLWMTLTMGLWLVVLGIVVYLTMRFALRDADPRATRE